MKSMSSLGLIAAVAALACTPCLRAAESSAKKDGKTPKGYDKTKDVGAPPPKGADVPFDGTKKSIEENWEMWPKADMKITWRLAESPTDDGNTLMTNGGKRWGTHDLVTKKKYTDFEGHVDFVLMGKRGDDRVEGYSNSGVYLQNRYEIQIESPKSKKDVANPTEWKIGGHGIGAIIGERPPDRNAWRPNGQWHAFHFVFKAARWKGKKCVAPARTTVWWNGVKIHDNVAIKFVNGGIKVGPSPGGLKLQEHGQDVRFRNIWIQEARTPKKDSGGK